MIKPVVELKSNISRDTNENNGNNHKTDECETRKLKSATEMSFGVCTYKHDSPEATDVTKFANSTATARYRNIVEVNPILENLSYLKGCTVESFFNS